jgi:hypothetical protein
VKPTSSMTWLCAAGALAAALAGGCGGSKPGDGVSTPGTIGEGNINARPENGTTRGDGTGVSAGDHDKMTNEKQDPNKDTKPDNSGPGPR